MPDTSGLSLETQSKIAELEVRAAPAATATAACLPLTPAADVADCAQTEKATAVEAEDYDKAKSIKQQIEDRLQVCIERRTRRSGCAAYCAASGRSRRFSRAWRGLFDSPRGYLAIRQRIAPQRTGWQKGSF